MTVDPGVAGSPFIMQVLPKIRELARLKAERGYDYIIEIDSDCNRNYAGILKEAGAEMLVMGGSGLFKLDADLTKAWEKMREYI